MKDIIEISFFSILFLAITPCVIYLWIHFIYEILDKINYKKTIKIENDELIEQIIQKDYEIKHLREHIKNS
jgi:hypothetical protein